ncbi:MAG: hypothetical protein ACPLSM_02540 [Thermosphaera sp.]
MLIDRTRRGLIKVREKPEMLKKISLLISEYLTAFYSYNSLIKDKNYYLKPVHMVVRRLPDGSTVKYYYYGRYWYSVQKTSRPSRIKWVYRGKSKPDPSLPDPPANPIEGLVVKQFDDYVELVFPSEELFKRIYDKLIQH